MVDDAFASPPYAHFVGLRKIRISPFILIVENTDFWQIPWLERREPILCRRSGDYILTTLFAKTLRVHAESYTYMDETAVHRSLVAAAEDDLGFADQKRSVAGDSKCGTWNR